MATGVSVTSTAIGELRVSKSFAHGALNCLVVLNSDPSDWYFKQFFSMDDAAAFATANNLTIKESEDEDEV